jgi:hypothetical protein
MDRLGRNALPVEIETNGARIHCARHEPVVSDWIRGAKKPTLLDRQSKSENFVLVKDIYTVWAINEYY